MKGRKAVLEKADLLCKVAAAFREVGESAARIAYGGKAVCDLSAESRLAGLARRAAECLPPSPDCPPERPNPLAELAAAVETLRELVALEGRAVEWKHGGAFGKRVQAFFDWCHKRGLRIDGGPDCVIRDDAGPEHLRRTVAGQLAADCKVCRVVAELRADALLWDAALRSGCEDREKEARMKEWEAKAEMHKARAETWEAKVKGYGEGSAEWNAMKKRADEERKEAAKAEEKAEVLRAATEEWREAGKTLEMINAEHIERLQGENAELQKDVLKALHVAYDHGPKTQAAAENAAAAAQAAKHAAKQTDARAAAAIETFGDELDRERKRRAALAVEMKGLEKRDPALWKFVEAWAAGGTQGEVAARYNQVNRTRHNQSWVAKQLAKLRQSFPSQTLDPGGAGRVHNSEKAKKAAAGNRMASGEKKVELQQEPDGGWIGENDL